MTLKLLLQYGGFAMICAVSNTPIHCSKSLVKHVLVYIGKHFDEELPKQEDVCDTAKDTEHIYCACMYLVYCGATTQIMVNSYL